MNGKGYPRYFFSQVSDDIRSLFCEAYRMVGVECRLNRWNSVSIARGPERCDPRLVHRAEVVTPR